MSSIEFNSNGLEELQNLMKDYIQATSDSDVTAALKSGADQFVKDLLKLPKPKSRITTSTHTHMVDSFSDRINGKDVEVGWGKYYGFMVENGTRKMRAQPHFKPTYRQNAEKYYKTIVGKLWKGV